MLTTKKSRNANTDESLETTNYYSPHNGKHVALWLSMSCANVQVSPQVKSVLIESCAGVA